MNTGKHGDDAVPGDEVRGWFAGRLPAGWFTGAPEVLVDREEITVVGPLDDLGLAADAAPLPQQPVLGQPGRGRGTLGRRRDQRLDYRSPWHS